MSRGNLIYTDNQIRSLKKDGEYKNRHINKFSDYGIKYDNIKAIEESESQLHRDLPRSKLATKVFRRIKNEYDESSSEESQRSRRRRSSSRRRSTRTRRRRGRSSSSSSSSRSRRRRSSSSRRSSSRRRSLEQLGRELGL